MSGVGEAIAISSIIITGTRVVSDVVRLVLEVKNFKPECCEVRDDCVLVLELMNRNAAKKVDQRTLTRIKDCFERSRLFLKQCAEEWGLFRATIEILFRRKHQSLKEGLKWAMSIFTIDALTELLDIASGRHLSIEAFDAKLETSMRSIENNQKRSINLASELQSELRAVRREVANTRRLTLDIPHFGKSISFISETDTRLQLGPAERGANSLYGQLESFGAIECTKLVGENSGGAMQVPRLVNIYSRISQRTVCRKLWGILKRSDGDYAVMESLAESDTLEHLLSSGDFLSKLNLVQRLHLAWEISNAVAYLHSVNILLKTLSSQNIHIFGVGSSGGTIRPVLTDLENARLITENSTEQEQDVRFEAPDFFVQGNRCHSIHTDVWSLGILIRCCVTGELPFSQTWLQSSADKGRVRQVIARGGSFWASTKLKHLPKLEHLLQSCFKQAGSMRPPTLTVSATLFDVWSELKNAESPSITVDDQDSEQVITQTKERAFALIYQARPGKGKKSTARMDQVPGKDVELIHHHSDIDPYHSTDPGCTFLLGAIAWYQLLPPDWVQLFDIADGMCRARFAIERLSQASLMGYQDCSLELSNAHEYLARIYAEDMVLKQESID